MHLTWKRHKIRTIFPKKQFFQKCARILKKKKGNNLYNTSWRLSEKTIKRQKLTKKKKQGKVVNVFKASKKRFRKERQLKAKRKYRKLVDKNQTSE